MADVLKIYFRELPDPIFTFDLYDKFMNLEGMVNVQAHAWRFLLNFILAEASDEEDYHKKLLVLINQLPPDHHYVLVYLIKFLLRICAVKENLMSTASLAIIWAPTLLFPRHQTIESTFLMPRGHKLFQVLMDNFSYYFHEESPSASTRSAKKKKKKSIIESRLTRGEKWMIETFGALQEERKLNAAAQSSSQETIPPAPKQLSDKPLASPRAPSSPRQGKT